MAIAALLWNLGRRNADEVMGVLEKIIAVVLIVISLCVGGLHQLLGFGLLILALKLPRARVNQAPLPAASNNEIFLPF
ncbi:hypothetical protein [Synechococcus sp. UW140]|uniref:hypothetical protein n=1 Tax=Synechococcus sp. UW140 TaxID=368503 RepID=UPI0025CDC4CB|nr:hypothetical protein [Synechococcus sp. UW140]